MDEFQNLGFLPGKDFYKDPNLAYEGFLYLFTEACSRLPDDSQETNDSAVFDSIKQTCSFFDHETQQLVLQEWFDESKFLAKLIDVRKGKCSEEELKSLRFSAKMLTIFILETSMLSIKVKNDYPHVCMEFVIRLAPQSMKLYHLLFQQFFRPKLMSVDKRQSIYKCLLDTFDPDNCRFFLIAFEENELSEALEFFNAWLRKLEECNFTGSDIENHLAQLTCSVLSAEIDKDLQNVEYWDLVNRCLNLVPITAMMRVKLTPYVFNEALCRKVLDCPPTTLPLFFKAFVQDDVVSNAPEHLRVAYGQVYSCIYDRFEPHLGEQACGIFSELSPFSQRTLASFIEDFLDVNKFVDENIEFINNLDTNIYKWKAGLLSRAVEVFDFAARHVYGIAAYNSDFSTNLPLKVAALLGAFDVKAIPASALIVGHTKLLFSLLGFRAQVLQMNSLFSFECLCLVTYFNTRLWPKIKDKSDSVNAVRSFYPHLLTALKSVSKLLGFSDKNTPMMVIYDAVYALSETPGKDMSYLITQILEKDFTYFDSALIMMLPKADFDITPFFWTTVHACINFDKLMTAEKVELGQSIDKLLGMESWLSTSQIRLLKLMKSITFKKEQSNTDSS